MPYPTPYRIATLAAACCTLFAASAHAVDWTGYMRGGPAATSESGKSRQCYGIGELKYRLGNECDFYGEFQLAQAMKADGVDFNAVLMTNYYSPATESNSNYGVEGGFKGTSQHLIDGVMRWGDLQDGWRSKLGERQCARRGGQV